jgi:hypothetical protein
MKVPTKEQIKEARIKAGLSQSQAAESVHLGAYQRWQEYESGKVPIDMARWELFQLKHGKGKSK